MMFDAERDHPNRVVMFFHVPRRVKMMPGQKRLTASRYWTPVVDFPAKYALYLSWWVTFHGDIGWST